MLRWSFTYFMKRRDELYDREKAVAYANKWWDSHNPAYPHFPVDCTNYISQCVRAGGGETWGYPDRSRGWWIQNGTWSFSWSVAHSFRWYLAGSTRGLRAEQRASANLLQLGDVICYDFSGDGRYDHTTIVTGFRDGEPVVNAHTASSYHRDWRYTTSPAFQDETRYTFFHIL